MSVRYLHLPIGHTPPALEADRPFRALLVLEAPATDEWRTQVAQWLVDAGCLYAMTWGQDCERWHDSVDWAVLGNFGFGDIPDDRFVMTTWHSGEPLSEALWFAAKVAFHSDVPLPDILLIDIGPEERRDWMLAAYAEAQQDLSDGPTPPARSPGSGLWPWLRRRLRRRA